ncbi:MAG: DNA polymerase IV [Planctomycetota bacterium]
MILHVDMDAFFAAVEQRDAPELRGKPVVVGGGSGRGVVQAASYEARRYGVHSAMPGQRAKELCPDAIFVPGRMSHYADIGRQVRDVFHRFTPLVQPLSLDEAFLDVSGTIRLHGSARLIGQTIKAVIRDELDLTASVGIAPLKFVAKIASDLQKPDGFVEVEPGDVQSFLDPLSVSRLWGVGKVGVKRLAKINVHRIADLRRMSQRDLRTCFGSWGEHLHRLANGMDARRVVPDRSAKQISHERTFHDDLRDFEVLRGVVSFLTEQVTWRLRQSNRLAKSVTLKYRREDFETFTRASSFKEPTDSTRQIMEAAIDLLAKMRASEPRPVRLIGVSAGALTEKNPVRQMSLFDLKTNETSERAIDQVSDRLRAKIGGASVHRGSSHLWKNRKRRPGKS